jgi:hypothetical protein
MRVRVVLLKGLSDAGFILRRIEEGPKLANASRADSRTAQGLECQERTISG